MSEERNTRKTRVGKVVSDKMEKTVVVAVEDIERHALYKTRRRPDYGDAPALQR